MQKPKRVVVVGGLHPEGGPNEHMGEPVSWYAHSICGSTWGIAHGLSQHGFDAYPFKGFRDREPFDSADALFVSEWNLAEYVEENGLWDFEKKPAVLLLHSPSPGKKHTREELLGMYRGICFTREEARHAFCASLAVPPSEADLARMWVAEWGFPDWWTFPPERDNPYKRDEKNIVYAGRLTAGHRVYQWLKLVAAEIPEALLWVIANVEPGSEEIEDELREIPNVRYLGKLPHGTFQHYLYYADVALDSGTAGEARLVNNCKLWDYLAAGVPVVLDGATGGDELVSETGLGTIVPAGDGAAYVRAVRARLDERARLISQIKRNKAIDWMRENYTWGATVARWADKFREAVES